MVFILSMNLHLVLFYNMLTEDAISVAISRIKSSTYVLDPVPAKLFKVSIQCISREKKKHHHKVLSSELDKTSAEEIGAINESVSC